MELILVDLLWFLAGLILFLFFSFVKVHMYVSLQTGILNGTVNRNKPFNGYPKRLWKDTKSSPLFRLTFNYLFRSKKSTWVSINNSKVDTGLEVMEAFTTFIKPYLIVSLLFFLLKGMLAANIHYERLTVQLGEVQQMLDFIHSLPFVAFITKYKSYIILVLAIICIAIPWLYRRKEKTKSIQKHFTRILLYFGLLTSISFFGLKIEGYSLPKNTELIEIKFEIGGIHNQIFEEASRIIIEKRIIQFVQSSNLESDKFNKEIDDKHNRRMKRLYSKEIRSEFLLAVVHLKDSLNKELRIDESMDTSMFYKRNKTLPKYHYNHSNFSSFIASKKLPFQDYLTKKSTWNIKNGNDRLTKVKTNYQQHTASTVKNNPKLSSKEYKIIQKIADFIINKGVSSLAEISGFGDNKIIKKILTVTLTKNWRNQIYQGALSLLGYDVDIPDKEVPFDPKIDKPTREKGLSKLDELYKKNKELDTEIRIKKRNETLRREINGLIKNMVNNYYLISSGEIYAQQVIKNIQGSYFTGVEFGNPTRANAQLKKIKSKVVNLSFETWVEKINHEQNLICKCI